MVKLKQLHYQELRTQQHKGRKFLFFKQQKTINRKGA